MSIYAKIMSANDSRDVEAWAKCHHEDYEFVRHQSGSTMNLEQTTAMIRQMYASSSMVLHSQRCIYENEDIIVAHQIMDFADNTKEAVLIVHTLKDGLIIRTETGATPLNK